MEMAEGSQFQGYLVGQVIASSVGVLLLVLEDFAGFYYYDFYNHIAVYGYIYLGSGVLPTILTLLGVGGLLVALQASIKSLQTRDASPALLKENAQKSIKGAGFTAALTFVSAVVFILSSYETDWWLGSGFYGAFAGGLLTVFFGRQILDKMAG